MSPRALGLVGVGTAIATGGTATLLRASYLTMPAWRRGVAWGCIALGLILLAMALKKR